MVQSPSLCVTPGSTVQLSCDPGGQCITQCSWITGANKQCSWSETGGFSCDDPSVKFISSTGSCNIEIENIQPHHNGTWHCMATPAVHSFVDHVDITVTNGQCPGTGISSQTKDALLWTGLAFLILVIIIAIILLFLFCCPAFCLCIPFCARRHQKKQGSHYNHNKGDDHLHQSRTVHDVVIDNNAHHYRDVRQVPHHHSHTQISVTGDVHSEISDSDDGYEVPRIYSSAAVTIKSAKKKSNFSNANLEDRMRKASGIGRVEQM